MESAHYGDFLTTKFDNVSTGHSSFLFQYPFVTACCGMEYMSASCSHYDVSRFGAEIPRFSPRQSDVLWVVGTVTHKMTPILRNVYDQMAEPKWVIAFGACASSGGFYQNYSVLQGIDRVIPVDVYIAGCPPRPEAVLDGLMELQNRIQNDGPSAIQGSINSAAIPSGPKETQLSRFLEISKPKWLRMFRIQRVTTQQSQAASKDYINTSATLGYDTPEVAVTKTISKQVEGPV